MEEILVVPRELGWFARLANALMIPLMYFLAGTVRERPQHTHPWTCQNLTPVEIGRLDMTEMVHLDGDWSARPRLHRLDPTPHIPALGGWRNYVVLDSMFAGPWYLGWRLEGETVQVSRISQRNRVRALLGPEQVSFFGVDKDGLQTPIYKIAEGRIGDRGEFCKTPLS